MYISDCHDVYNMQKSFTERQFVVFNNLKASSVEEFSVYQNISIDTVLPKVQSR